MRAGSDVLQSFTFFASDDQLQARGVQTTGAEINEAGMRLVKRVAAEGDALTGGGIARGPSYANGVAKAAVQEEFRKQARIFAEGGLDFLICEACDQHVLTRHVGDYPFTSKHIKVQSRYSHLILKHNCLMPMP